MPTICKYENCRGYAVYGYFKNKPLYCSEHRLPDTYNTKFLETVSHEPATNSMCSHSRASSKYKGYCVNCYIRQFPDDPLSFQTLYKSKIVATQKFIDAKFDGFVHSPDFSEININGYTLHISFAQSNAMNNYPNIIHIEFNLNKYADGTNPQLYTRLPKLEQLIAEHMENIIG